MRLLAVCVCCLASAPAAWGFQNLDFEDTLFDFDPFLDPFEPFETGSGDPAVVTPGWSFRAEFPDGGPVGQTEPDLDGFFLPYPVHGDLTTGHIGTTSQVILTGFSEFGVGFFDFALQGEHSLYLDQALDGSFTGSDERPIPVAVQNGVVPQDAQSLLILVAENFAPANPDNQFSVRLNGFEVEMHPVDLADYPDVAGPPQGGTYFAGNIAPVAGLERELAIRPEPFTIEETDLGGNPVLVEFTSIVFDNVAFSAVASPFPPVQVPEPAAGLLLAVALLGRGSPRRDSRR